ncbi:MAG: response regulator transcription factor [Anaerolineae bacterium]|nr:response regulator transcription factor [Anaerolineae bacterium]
MQPTNPMHAKILIVDDEPPIIDVLRYNLRQAGYDVVTAWDGEQALQLAQSDQPHLIILDLMLPKLDGIEVCKRLRKVSDTPIIMLTARDEEIDRVLGLELGADDYVVKPFSVRELLARVKSVLRRTQQPAPTSPSVIHVANLVIDIARYEARIAAHPLDLTALEFKMLHNLALQPGRVLTREQLLDQVWGYDYHGDLRVVDAVIKRLRAKLRKADPKQDLIATVRGVGYKLDS